LQGWRQFADLVEKQRSTLRQFKPPPPLPGRASESAPLVAEQFAFKQRFRNRRAIDLNTRGIAPLTKQV
jgi:hypothetical protein